MMNARRTVVWAAVVGLIVSATATLPRADAADDAHIAKAKATIDKGIEALRKTQGEDGSWSPKPGPAITAMALRVMLDKPGAKLDDPAVAKALAYVMSKVRPDGGIHDGILENYNTAICLSALSRVNNKPEVAQAIKKGQDYLRGLQWAGQDDPHGKKIDEKHAFYGGAGYGRDGRPDMSNTQTMLDGLYDSGLDCNDPAFQRALVFITRCQGTKANKDFGNKIRPDGGFIYATSLNKDKIGEPESKPGEETIDVPGAGPRSVLRTYGSMTYAGFKSYLYAKLDRNDPRVQDAFGWIRRNYDLTINPGMVDDPKTPADERMQGYYYYLVTFSKALDAWGEKQLTLASGEKRDWANDLIDRLVSTQSPEGTWSNPSDRWMEGDVNLVTAYALIALQHAAK